MKKIIFIYCGDIEFCPYFKDYENIISSLGYEYDVMFWKRQKDIYNYPSNYMSFTFDINKSHNKIFKFWGYYLFAKWVNKRIKNNQYFSFVFLDTLSGIACNYFAKLPMGVPCILEIRDYTFENISFFKKMELTTLARMKYVFISSAGFNKFLPQSDYHITHNFNKDEYLRYTDNKHFKKVKNKEVFTILWVGILRYPTYQKAIIEELGNDPRFNLIYHGTGPDYQKLTEFCDQRHYLNVQFTGRYSNQMKENLLKDADLLLNCYDINNGAEVLYAVSNKYYDGLIYHIPQIVERNTFKASLIEKYNLGLCWTPGETGLGDRIITYYNNIDSDAFNNNCISLMNGYYKEYSNYLDLITNFYSDMRNE